MSRRPPGSTRLTHPCPTRRSSHLGRRLDVHAPVGLEPHQVQAAERGGPLVLAPAGQAQVLALDGEGQAGDFVGSHLRAQEPPHGLDRSEEHTSELQSLMRTSYAVFCLKKKKTK